MTDQTEELIKEAHDFLNGDPENRVPEFLLVKEATREMDDDSEEDSEERYLEIVEIPLHDRIHTELNSIFVEELYKIVSKTVYNDEVPVKQYNAGNIHEEPTPIQHIPFTNLPDHDLFSILTETKTFPEGSYEELGSADFQVLRVRDKWGNMLLAFRKFTRRQIVGSSWKVKLMLSGDEYNIFEDDLFALPEKFDTFFYDGEMFVKNQGRFEDIFNYFSEYEDRTETVLDGLEESEITIHNAEFFKEAIGGDKSALRKMAVVEERGLYEELTKEKVKTEIEKYNLNLEESNQNGDWGVTLPSKGDKKDLIRLLNDDNLFSESTETRYQARGKRRV